LKILFNFEGKFALNFNPILGKNKNEKGEERVLENSSSSQKLIQFLNPDLIESEHTIQQDSDLETPYFEFPQCPKTNPKKPKKHKVLTKNQKISLTERCLREDTLLKDMDRRPKQENEIKDSKLSNFEIYLSEPS
jgi:hypothetical protein